MDNDEKRPFHRGWFLPTSKGSQGTNNSSALTHVGDDVRHSLQICLQGIVHSQYNMYRLSFTSQRVY